MDVGLLLRYRALLWNAWRHCRRDCLNLHGLDSGQGHGRDTGPLLVMVNSFPQRHRHLLVHCCRLAKVILCSRVVDRMTACLTKIGRANAGGPRQGAILLGCTGPAASSDTFTFSRKRHVEMDGKVADAVLGR